MLSPVLVGLLQALGVVSYITLVATFIENVGRWFRPEDTFSGPILFLTLFSTSVLVCGLLALGYPVRLFWIEKKPKAAIAIVGYMALFLVIFVLGLIVSLASAT